MRLPSQAEILAEAQRALRESGRVALGHIVRTEGSTPGKVGWRLLIREDGSTYGNLGGGAFEAIVQTDGKVMMACAVPVAEIKRYYFTETAVRGEPTGMVCGGLAEVFLEVLMAKPLLVVCGGGPVGQAIAQHGALCDFENLVVEDREEFRDPDLFPAETKFCAVDREYSGEFMADFAHRELFVAIVTRCWETDRAALLGVARQTIPNLRYLGLMGSQRKIDRVRDEVETDGVDLKALNLQAPIGLPIGAETPSEIAISILAQVIRSRGTAEEEAS